MKKILTLILALTMVVSAFTACKKDTETVVDDELTTGTSKDDVQNVTYADLGENIVAKAGEYEITLDDIAIYIDLLVPYIQQSTGSNEGWEETVLSNGLTARDELLNAAIEECRYQLAFIDYAKAKGFFNDEVAKSYFDEYLTNIGGMEVFEEILTEYNFKEDSFKNYVNYMGAYTAVSENSCSDEDAAKIYDESYITAKHILVLFEGRNSEDEALKEALDIYEKAAAGNNFEELIEKHNEDPGQNAETGYTFTYGEMVDEFYESALSLEEGEISKPVKTTYGYHVIKRYANPGKDTESYKSYIAKIKSNKANEFLSDAMYEEIIAEYPLVINEGILSSIDLSRYTVVLDENANYADGSVFNE